MSGGRFYVHILAAAIIALGIIGDPGARSIASTEASTFNASVDFSTTQGHRGWSYLDSSGAPLTYDSSSGHWYGGEAHLKLWPRGGHPGNSRGAMRRWTAAESGSIRVTGNVFDNDSRGGDGVEFVIRKNGTVVWRGVVANGNKAGLAYDLALQVAAQDRLDFVIYRGVGSNSYDSTYFDPVITYSTPTSGTTTPSTGGTTSTSTSSTRFQASVDFSTTQGHRGWSYRDSTGAPLVYSVANARWDGSEAYLSLWRAGGHPGSSRGAMLRWTAPQGGSIRVNGTVRDSDPSGGDGVEFVIRKNGTVLWRQNVANGNSAGATYDLALSVAADDDLDFIVNRGSGNNSSDTTSFDPTVTYGSSTTTATTNTPTPPSAPLPPPPPTPAGLHAKLLGPVAPIGQWIASIEQSAASVLAGKPVSYLLTETPSSSTGYGWLGPNFYDRTAWCYRYAAASGRADILNRCRFYAREISNQQWMANLECRAKTGNWQTCTPLPPNRDNSPLGLALAATDSRDSATQATARNGLARSAYGGFAAVSNTSFQDPRENGNGLLALALSHAVGPDATPARWGVPWDSFARARTMLDTILAAQESWGCWNTIYDDPQLGFIHTPVYMQGMLLAGLQAYADFVHDDSRILPAVKRCVEWLQETYQATPNPVNSDNRRGEGGWVYSYHPDGESVANGNVYPSLSGMIIGSIAWLWQRTGDSRWYALADAAFVGLVREGVAGAGTGINSSKEANQWARPVVNWASSR